MSVGAAGGVVTGGGARDLSGEIVYLRYGKYSADRGHR